MKDTLSRFATAPRKALRSAESNKGDADATPQKTAIDVDAFKRLLLTGESSTPSAPSAPQNISDSSSTTDTASTSQRSLFEGVPPTVEETPRSSYEQERPDLGSQRQHASDTPTGLGARRRPPPPKPRHGRAISESTRSSSQHDLTVNSSSEVGQAEVQARSATKANSQSEEPKRRPPPPPLARRKSSKNQADRPTMAPRMSSQQSLTSESDEALSPRPNSSTNKMAPPPPPLRRSNTSNSRNTSSDLPSTAEEDESGITTPEARPVGSRTSSSTKRISQAAVGHPPPLPPPRRNRTSSRGSTDSQRPSLSGLGISDHARNSSEYRRPSDASDSRNVSGGSNAGVDILADLAALQREVDAARASAGR